MKLKNFLIIIFIASPAHADNNSKNDKTLNEIIELCVKEKFPNSMARTPGFDLDKYLDENHQILLKTESYFYSENGIKFLKNELNKKTDDLDKICIKDAIKRAQENGKNQ